MAQSIKSLKEQVKDIKIDNFVINEFGRGDYGYNMLYGLFDNKVVVGTLIPHMKDSDAGAPAKIATLINNDISTAKSIQQRYTPQNCELICFIDCNRIMTVELGYLVQGVPFWFEISKTWHKKNHQPYEFPIEYTPKQFAKEFNKSIDANVANLKTILNTKGFTFEKYDRIVTGYNTGKPEVAKRTNKITYEWSAAHDYQFFGKANGKDITFTIPIIKFEKLNMKKYMKKVMKGWCGESANV